MFPELCGLVGPWTGAEVDRDIGTCRTVPEDMMTALKRQVWVRLLVSHGDVSRESGDFEKEVSEPRAQVGPSLWHIPRRIARCPDTARSIRGTVFPPAHLVFHAAQPRQE